MTAGEIARYHYRSWQRWSGVVFRTVAILLILLNAGAGCDTSGLVSPPLTAYTIEPSTPPPGGYDKCYSFVRASSAHEQDAKDGPSKMEAFVAKAGQTVKFTDYQLPKLNMIHTSADSRLRKRPESRIRKIVSGGEIKYFYQISMDGNYSTQTASIAEEDLQDTIEALDRYRSRAASDKAQRPGELMCSTSGIGLEDGSEVGYLHSDGEAAWFIRLDAHLPDSSLIFPDFETVRSMLLSAQSEIDELRIR